MIDDFRANVLLKVDILEFEQIILDINKRSIIFSICDNLIAIINFIFKNQRITNAIRSINQIIISFHFNLTISIKIREINLSINRDYNFDFKQNFQQLNLEKDFFNHVIDAHLIIVSIRNVINKSIILSKYTKIDMLYNFDEKKYYMTSFDNRHLTIVSSCN